MSDVLSADRRFRIRLKLARAALFWEKLWPAAWPALGIAGVFLVLGLFDALPLLPSPVHAAVLALLLLAFAAAVAVAVRSVVWPERGAARRRIEQASGLAHRPLQALADAPSTVLDPAAETLWEAHRARMAAAARRLRAGWPAAGIARRDPWGLRALLVALLLFAGIDAGADWRDRLARAVTPNVETGAAAVATTLDIWVTPPDYTGLPPQFLNPANGDIVKIPTGSKVLAQVHGGGTAPHLTIDRKSQVFETIDKSNYRAAATLTAGTELSVSQSGSMLGKWPIEIIPDHPPQIAFAKPPQGTPRAALRLDYRAGDDYGVESVKAVIRRDGGKPDETITLDLPLPGLHLKDAKDTSYHDLSPHPWAGLPVEIRLVATDALGQTGQSEPVQMVLPERTFRIPIARAIIDQRKELAKDPNSHDVVAEVLGDLNKRPALYRDDAAVYLALHVAQDRLRQAGDPQTIAQMEQLLWDTALHIEEGNMSLAERDLRRLEQQLQDALARNAPDAEVERLMRELQQALNQYMQALAQELQQHPNERTDPIDPSQVITGRDLQRMLDRARELARNGMRDQARELLSQLQNMLENLRMARPGEMQQQGTNQAQQMMRNLHELMQRQQQLLDRSFRAQRQGQQGQRGQPGQPGQQGQQGQQPGDQQDGGADMSDAAGQQEALRRMLGEMMRRLGDGSGDIPAPFARAERSMRGAAEALKRGQPGQAIGPQTDALDQLQQAAREFAQRMQQRLGPGIGRSGEGEVGATDRPPRDQIERDPFGRPTSNDGFYDQGDVKIPEQSTLQKSREILDELRRRAGERFRPEIELDYIERLLKRF